MTYVVATKFYQQTDIDLLREKLPGVDFWFPKSAEDLENLEAVVVGANVFLGPPPSARVLGRTKETLKLIQIPWAGVDGVDFASCRKYSITCANSHSNATSVAELAISLCLDVLKSTPFHDAEMRLGRWHRPSSAEGFFPPRLLTGLSVGIFGFGSIGREIKQLLAGFEVDVSAVSYSKRDIEGVRTYDRETELHEFFSHSEIVFLTAPLTPQTMNIICDENLAHIQNKAVLVNVARAELIDVRSLHRALVENRIFGAALDVHWRGMSEEEELLSNEIAGMRNVVLSPHRGGFVEAEKPHLLGAIENIKNVDEGNLKAIRGKLDFERGY